MRNWQRSLLVLGALALSPSVQADVVYRIDGVPAPQVRAQTLTKELEQQLKVLKAQLEERSQKASLDQALEAGLLNNPQLAVAYSQIQGQQWNLISVRRQWYPTLNISSSSYVPGQRYSTTKSSFLGQDPTSSRTNATDTSLGLTIGWTFFDPSRGANINAAVENLKQQRLLFDVSARNLVLDIQQAYFSLQEAKQLIESYAEILKFTRREVKTIEVQFNNGLANIADVEQIRTQQYATLTTLINTYKQLINTSSVLAQTMALPPGTLVLPSDELIPLGRWDEPLQPTINQALLLREEIQASLAAAASANWSATSLFNTYWPRFSIGASGQYAAVNTNSTNFPLGYASYQQSQNWNGGFGLGFTWQIFDGGINAGQAEVQKSYSRQAQNQASVNRLSVASEVEQAYGAYLASQMALQSTDAQVKAARAAAAGTQARYQVGLSDISSLVVALNQAIGAARDYANAVSTYNSAVARLYRSSARWPAGTQPKLRQRVSTLGQV